MPASLSKGQRNQRRASKSAVGTLLSEARYAVREIVELLQRAAAFVVVPVLLAWERIESGVACDVTSKQVRANPYPLYRQLREQDPVHRLRLIGAWVLTRYDDVDALLRDHRRFANEGRDFGYLDFVTLLALDPPDHTRLRSLVSQAFASRTVSDLESRIQRIVDGLLDAVADQERLDLMKALAHPLPLIVIAEMLGVPARDIDRFEAWSKDLALITEPGLRVRQIRRARKASDELFEYFEGIIEQRRRDPRDDLISTLLAAEEAGDRLTRDEMLATLLLLLVAGNETTRNLIGNGTLALLKNPDQLQRLAADPSLLTSAIDELLRYDSPVQLSGRIAREDTTIGGKRIRAGQRVVGVLGAANRDPAVFANPDTLDIGRRDQSHLAFGRGIHHCLGSSLAVLEGRIAFASILERFAAMRLVAEPRYRNQLALRGLDELWVEVEHAPRTPSSETSVATAC